MNEESKRKFSGKNLYKLTKILVIFISLLSLIMLLTSIQSLNHADDNCRQYSSKAIDSSLRSLWESCDYSAGKVQQNSIYLIDESIKGIILLPLFFGGTWLYKYLFPKKKNE